MSTTIRKWDFTLDRGKGLMERTVVGKDGQVHHPRPNGHGKDGHFSADEERNYRMLIEAAVSANSGSRGQRISVGPLEYDSFGLLPSDGFGRLSSEDY